MAPEESLECPWLLLFGLCGPRSLPREGRRNDERKECGDFEGVGRPAFRKVVRPVLTVNPFGFEVELLTCSG